MREISNKICIDEKETVEFARTIAPKLRGGAIVLLEGSMGAGKSVFARAVINALGYNGAVTSPTFVLMNEYPTYPPVYHFDMYRLSNPDQLYDIGFSDYIYSDGISLIEWPSKMEYLCPEKYISVNIERLSENERKITVSTNCDEMLTE